MNKREFIELKHNNKGLSLVELIVAISVGVIVASAIAALMTFAIRMYRNESANLSAQYELQTNVNQIIDSIMGANCYVIQKVNTPSATAPNRLTEYAAFGKFNGSDFDGVIFVAGEEKPSGSGRFNIYMDRGKWPGSTALAAVSSQVSVINADMTSAHSRYLLGEGSTQFRIEPKILTASPKTYVNITASGYKNPLSVEVELNFQKDATGKVVNRHVKDEALIRNKISTNIYIDGIEFKPDKAK